MRLLHKAQLAIVGTPGTGKTTLGRALGAALGLGCCSTDQFMDVPWSDQADEAMLYLPVRGIVEGITVARLFRRGFEPDCVLYLRGRDIWPGPLASLVQRGLREYPGRVLHLQARCSVEAALAAIGGCEMPHQRTPPTPPQRR